MVQEPRSETVPNERYTPGTKLWPKIGCLRYPSVHAYLAPFAIIAYVIVHLADCPSTRNAEIFLRVRLDSSWQLACVSQASPEQTIGELTERSNRWTMEN